MNEYRSMKPCIVCGGKPTRVIQWKRISNTKFENLHFCYKHDPFGEWDEDKNEE